MTVESHLTEKQGQLREAQWRLLKMIEDGKGYLLTASDYDRIHRLGREIDVLERALDAREDTAAGVLLKCTYTNWEPVYETRTP